MKVADLTCGTGQKSVQWAADVDYWGFDADPRHVAIARDTFGSTTRQFSCVDIFNFNPGILFDKIVADLTQFGDIARIVLVWEARRYHFVVKVADKEYYVDVEAV